MILHLDPSLPIVWRSPSSVQLGVDPAVVVIDDVTELQERIIAALAVGVTEPGLRMIASGHLDVRDGLLARLAPALAPAVAPAPVVAEPPDPVPTVAISGEGPAVTAIANALAACGARVLVAADATELVETTPDVAIVVAHHVIPPTLHALWLRRDIPHLPVVFSDAAAHIGPIIEPGVGPCLTCLELHRRDADPAWPAIATQLLGRRNRDVSPTLILDAAAAACRATLDRLTAGAPTVFPAIRIDGGTGGRREAPVLAHPECGCGGIQHLMERGAGSVPRPDRPESDWAAAARRAPHGTGRPRSARAAVARA